MFNIGGGELVVIALIALIVLGPQRLPDAARQMGKAMGELRRMSNGFQQELKSALDDPGPSAPRRDVLGVGGATASKPSSPGRDSAGAEPDAVDSAIEAVSKQPPAPNGSSPRRKAQLRAAPEPPAGDVPRAPRRRSKP